MRQAIPAGRGDGQSSSRKGAYSPSPACLHLPAGLSQSRKKHASPGPESPEHKGKESKFKVMEDGLTLVLVIVLCLVLRPLISAILRGLGSSEHRRDR